MLRKKVASPFHVQPVRQPAANRLHVERDVESCTRGGELHSRYSLRWFFSFTWEWEGKSRLFFSCGDEGDEKNTKRKHDQSKQ